MKAILFITLSLTSFIIQAQDIKTSSISWNGSSVFNPVTGETMEGQTTVISNSESTVTWQKSDGTTLQFNVVEAIGQWTNITSNGQMIYEISSADTRGNITFVKTSSGTSIRLILIKGDEDPLINEVTIDNFLVQ
jgi:hypothetical protein